MYMLILHTGHTFRVIYKAISDKIHENFDTSESQENIYSGIQGHAKHESGLSFFLIDFLRKPHTFRVTKKT